MHESSFVCNYFYAYIIVKTWYIKKFVCTYLKTLNFLCVPKHNGILSHHLSCICNTKNMFNTSIHKFYVSPPVHIHTNSISGAKLCHNKNLRDWWLPILNGSVFIYKQYSPYIAHSPAEFPDYQSLWLSCLCLYLIYYGKKSN